MIRFPVRTTYSGPQGPSRDRLNTLTDAVFAFSLTLLALELRIPSGLSAEEIGSTLWDLWPRILAFLLSFSVIASAWVYVHQMSTIFTKVCLAHLVLSLTALLFVATLPFTTATMGEYPTSAWGPFLYAANALALVLTYSIDFALSRSCIDPAVDRDLLKKFEQGHIASATVLAIGCALSFVDPRLAIAAVVLHVAGHWGAIWWFEGDMMVAQAAIRQPTISQLERDANTLQEPTGRRSKKKEGTHRTPTASDAEARQVS
jgi:uncharacterized membrane protein